ncbi:MAG: energy transducer TonB [Terriglobales bacterium]
MTSPGFRKPEAVAVVPDVLPSLFGSPGGAYANRSTNFLWSVLLHTMAVALALFAARVAPEFEWAGPSGKFPTRDAPFTIRCDQVKECGGGGRGHDGRPSSAGVLPRISQMQFTPPTVHIPSPAPQLPREATVVAPNVELPAMKGQVGDPFEGVTGPPSDGANGGSGIGNDGKGGGIGPRTGPGAGPGPSQGVYSGPFGGGVRPPRPLYAPDPDYSEEARKIKAQGTVVLWVVVGADGQVRDLRVQRSLGFGLDEKAVEAVRRWKFEPATKDDRPVAVQIYVEVHFRLY